MRGAAWTLLLLVLTITSTVVILCVLGQWFFHPALLSHDDSSSSSSFIVGYNEIPNSVIVSRTSTTNRLLLVSTGEKENDELTNTNSSIRTTATQLEIVLCTHVSVDKLDRLAAQRESWKGPMSVAVYLTSEEEAAEYQRFRTTNYQTSDHDVVFSTYRERNESLAPLYPHNILRNLAISNAPSDYIISLDADFLPSTNSYQTLTRKLKNDDDVFRQSLQQQTLYILPVFALLQGVTPPSTRKELVSMYHNKSAMEWHYAPGHAKIYYKAWTANDRTSPNQTLMDDFSYFIEPNPEFEPYFLCYRSPELPKYWETFRGFGMDKTSFTHELALSKYEFRVLWDFFVMHVYHAVQGKAEDRNTLANRNVDIWRKEFTPYLSNKYQPKGMEERWVYPRFRDYLSNAKQRQQAST
ncbi:unnamed protein product [Cylindrotheca closterium]|uniref:Uncharacterized protein n=1 Tax=Cylindrotheca closterium TaxID=2856 RepID=A0AAD2CZ84_9STRA|nr:unnamed protein product [Cylindrotheca closterium]